MTLPKFELYRPRTLDEALIWLGANRQRRVKILAGGTDLLVDIRTTVIPSGHRPPLSRPAEGVWKAVHASRELPEALCALWLLRDLRGINLVGNSIHIGAMTTLSELERSSLIREKLPALSDGASQLGSALVRNRGTYGGNLCNARPAADTAIPTLALGGKLTLASPRGERTVDHDSFTLGPGKTVLEPDEILKEIVFELPAAGISSGSSYTKLAQRKSLEIAVVGCAVGLEIDVKGNLHNLRIALGAVAPKPVLVTGIPEDVIGQPPSANLIQRVAKIASDFARPISDHRAGNEYRKEMVEVLVRRSFEMALGRARTTVNA